MAAWWRGLGGGEPPAYAHLPVIVNEKRQKLSKRRDKVALDMYRAEGYLPEAMMNYLALLGWSPKDNREKLDLAEVVQLFDLAKVHRKNAAFDLEKCTWLNGEYVRELGDERFQEMGRRALENAGLDLSKFSPEYVRAALEKNDVRVLRQPPRSRGLTSKSHCRPSMARLSSAALSALSRLW